MRKNVLLFILLCLIVTCFSGCFISDYNDYRNKKIRESNDTTFEEDYKLLQNVTSILMSDDYKNYESITFYQSSMLVRKENQIKIIDNDIDSMEDIPLKNVILELRKKGYDTISKRGTIIYFQRWTDIFTWDAGFALSINGSDELDIQYLTYQKALEMSNWYYYESDYNEWRSREYR